MSSPRVQSVTALVSLIGAAAFVLLAGAGGTAHAEGFTPVSLGARVGGYGFRGPRPDGGQTEWNVCRMNGLGLFGEWTLGRAFFVEAGLDGYFSDQSGSVGLADGGATAAWPIDRVSGLFTVAGGARLTTWRFFWPYVQLGVGVEATRVRAAWNPALDEEAVLPLGFIGLGGDLRLGGRFAVGMNLRVAAMGLFDRRWDAASGEDRFVHQTELATQAQLYAKFDL